MAKKGRKKATLYTNVANFTSGPLVRFGHNRTGVFIFRTSVIGFSYKTHDFSYKNIIADFLFDYYSVFESCVVIEFGSIIVSNDNILN